MKLGVYPACLHKAIAEALGFIAAVSASSRTVD
jgi:hypothetical protein